MRALKLLTVLIFSLTIAACASQETRNPPADMSQSQNFIPMAVSGDHFEIKSSKMALAKSKNPMVLRIAKRMITDHTASSKKMAALLAADGIQPPPPMPHHKKALEILRDASDFDQQYLETQDVAHQQAIGLFRIYSERGDNPDLRDFAAKTLPTLYKHLHMIQKARTDLANS